MKRGGPANTRYPVLFQWDLRVALYLEMRGNVLPKNVYILGEELNFNYLQFGFN